MEPSKIFGRPSPPPIEQAKSQEGGAAKSVNPQAVLTESTVRSMNAAMRSSPAPTRPTPGIAFNIKVKTPDELLTRRSVLLEVKNAVPKDLKPEKDVKPLGKIFNPTEVLNDEKLKDITQKKIEVSEKIVDALTQKLDEAKANQRKISQEGRKDLGKNDLTFMTNLLKSAENVKSMKNELQTALDNLKKLDPENKAFKTEVKTAESKPVLTKEQNIIGEIKSTEKTFVEALTKLNKNLNTVMQNDPKFNAQIFEKKILLEKATVQARIFESKLSACKTTEDIAVCYASKDFENYSNAMSNYIDNFTSLDKMVTHFLETKFGIAITDELAPELTGTETKKMMDNIATKNEIESALINPIQRMPRHRLLLEDLKKTTDNELLSTPLAKVKLGAEKANLTIALREVTKQIENFKPERPKTLASFRASMMVRAPKDTQPARTVQQADKILSDLLVFSTSQDPIISKEGKALFESFKQNQAIMNAVEKDPKLNEKFNNFEKVIKNV